MQAIRTSAFVFAAGVMLGLSACDLQVTSTKSKPDTSPKAQSEPVKRAEPKSKPAASTASEHYRVLLSGMT